MRQLHRASIIRDLTDLDEEDINEMMFLNGDEIMAQFGRKRDEHGDWSKDDLAFLEAECRRQLALIAE